MGADSFVGCFGDREIGFRLARLPLGCSQPVDCLVQPRLRHLEGFLALGQPSYAPLPRLPSSSCLSSPVGGTSARWKE